jgi:hypothetical protein
MSGAFLSGSLYRGHHIVLTLSGGLARQALNAKARSVAGSLHSGSEVLYQHVIGVETSQQSGRLWTIYAKARISRSIYISYTAQLGFWHY